MANQKKKAAAVVVAPKRNTQRRALSHVGGQVQYQGPPELRSTVERALGVAAEEGRTRAHVHGFHSYPARLHPDTARSLIEALSHKGDTVLDPFCGGGTVLLEARLADRYALGRDLNPLAVALAKLKTHGSSDGQRATWLASALQVAAAAEDRRVARAAPGEQYPKEDLDLFEIHVLLELDSLRLGIRKLDDAPTRRVLLLVLSSIITKVSRRHGDSSRKSSERRLASGHTIRLFRDRAQELMGQLAAFQRLVPAGSKPPDVRVDDARILATVKPGAADLVVTSPPYPGVYDYFDHHAARLRWLGMKSQEFARSEMGSRRQLNRLPPDLATRRWEQDFREALQAIARTLAPGKYAALIVADTAVSGRVLRGNELTVRLAKTAGLECAAIGSQRRPQFHFDSSKTFAGSPRLEHLLVLERPPSAPRPARTRASG